MVDNKTGSLFKKAVIGVIALASAYYVGLKQRPSFAELTPKMQQAVAEEHQSVEDLLEAAANNFKLGKIDDALKNFTSAMRLVPLLGKIDPKYAQIQEKLDKYKEFLEATRFCYVELNKAREHLENIEMPPSPTNADWIMNFYPFPKEFVVLKEQTRRSDEPELAAAARNALSQLFKEWKSAVEKLLLRLKQVQDNPYAKRMIKEIENSFLPELEQRIEHLSK
jgi:tetratricopeptide (TPR) repeat protein